MFKLNTTKKSRLCIVILLLLGTSFILGGCLGDTKKSEGPTFMPNVGVVELKAQNVLTTVELNGRVASPAIAEVRPQVNGIILKRMFEEGSQVKAGDQLYQIDPAIYQAQYDTAQANLKKAETSLKNTKSIVDRYTEIIKVKGVSQQEYDTAMAQYRSAEADVAAAKAAVQSAKINLDYTKVFSPVSGRVGISSVTEGALVTAAQLTPMVSVQQMDPMYIDITQSSADFLRLQRNLQSGAMADAGASGVEVRLVLEDGLPYEHTARLMLYDAAVSRSTGSITMRAVVDNPNNLLMPGMFVRTIVTEGITENALLVPLQAVERNPQGKPVVMVVNDNGLVEQRIIQTNRIYNNEAWIVLPGKANGDGLNEGDKVIVEGTNRVLSGKPAGTYPAGTQAPPMIQVPSAPAGN